MHSDSFLVRALAAFLVGISAPGSVLAASHYGASPGYWLITIPCGVLTAAILAGYFEPFVKRVWIHALLLMLPELVALPVAILTCKGHGCVAAIVSSLLLRSPLHLFSSRCHMPRFSFGGSEPQPPLEFARAAIFN